MAPVYATDDVRHCASCTSRACRLAKTTCWTVCRSLVHPTAQHLAMESAVEFTSVLSGNVIMGADDSVSRTEVLEVEGPSTTKRTERGAVVSFSSFAVASSKRSGGVCDERMRTSVMPKRFDKTSPTASA